jgi:hypothetical protein
VATHKLDAALAAYRKQKAAKPPGTFSDEDAAKRWKCSPEKARQTLTEMVRAKIMAPVPGHKITAAGVVQACTYYRLAK